MKCPNGIEVLFENRAIERIEFKYVPIGHPFKFCGAVMLKHNNSTAFNFNTGVNERMPKDMKVFLVEKITVSGSE